MAAYDPAQILVAHNRWANEQLLMACQALTPEQLSHPFEMGLGSLQSTLTHILGAMQGWTDMLNAAEPRPRLEELSPKFSDLVEWSPRIHEDFAAVALGHPAEEEVTRERQGRQYTFTRGGVLTHVTTHGMHHRAQCLNMLRHLGVDPLPPSAVVEWMLAGN